MDRIFVWDTLENLADATGVPALPAIISLLRRIDEKCQKIKKYQQQIQVLLKEGKEIIDILMKHWDEIKDNIIQAGEIRALFQTFDADSSRWLKYNWLKWSIYGSSIGKAIESYQQGLTSRKEALVFNAVVQTHRNTTLLIRDSRRSNPKGPTRDSPEYRVLLSQHWSAYGPWPNVVIPGMNVTLGKVLEDHTGSFSTCHGHTTGVDKQDVLVIILYSLEPRHIKALHRAVKILPTVKHENIVKFIGMTPKMDGAGSTELHMILEYCGDVNLFQYHAAGTADSTTRLKHITELSQALNYLHNEHKPPIWHANVLPTNIYVTPENGEIKLAGFTRAKYLDQYFTITGEHSGKNNEIICWYPPEIVRPPRNSVELNMTEWTGPLAVDVYMWGTCAYFTMTGNVPFAEHQDKTIFTFIPIMCDGPVDTLENMKEIGDEELSTLLCRSFNVDKSQRPKIKEVLEVLTRRNREATGRVDISQE